MQHRQPAVRHRGASPVAFMLALDVPNVSLSGMALSIGVVVSVPEHDPSSFCGHDRPDLHADQLRDHGPGRRRAHLRPHRRAAGGRRGLRHARERPGVDGQRARWRARNAPACGPGSTPTRRRHRHLHPRCSGDVRHGATWTLATTPDKQVLHDISLYAKPGQKVAFVGATGAGKTTITNLINRFYDIADGKIRYDGININKISKSDLRRSLGVVLQDTNLFTGTVMDNIRYGKLDATDEECIAAAKLAGADDFITRLPEGYNTHAHRQRQPACARASGSCISIARAAVADPPVMILDEATSSIDTRTEAMVQEGMDALMTGPHRLRHRASPLHRAQLRRNHLPRPRPRDRTWQPRRAHRQEGLLLPALHRRLRAGVAGRGLLLGTLARDSLGQRSPRGAIEASRGDLFGGAAAAGDSPTKTDGMSTRSLTRKHRPDHPGGYPPHQHNRGPALEDKIPRMIGDACIRSQVA